MTLNKVELIKDKFLIKVVEYSFLSHLFVVQRNKMIEILGGNFHSLPEDKMVLKQIVESFEPDVISMEEFPEMFMHNHVAEWLYRPDRPYKIMETTHDSSFNPKNKTKFPDKFVFVSPYNALQYAHFKIPYEIIEYPVDVRTRDKAAARKKLNLDDKCKHVIIVGLFTPRKNQKYAFELADQLGNYKIQFHFIGNQAGNFEHYWRPLMDWKSKNRNLDNCIVWGERSDVIDFVEAADLCLFPSKGDRGNKELNPIAIKEALLYEDLPVMMYNLDVYLNRYNNHKNIHFLTGNILEDAARMIATMELKSKDKHEEIIVIGTYPNLKSRVWLTKQTIESMKPLGRKIMLISHYPVDAEIQNMVDFYIFDKENPLTYHSYYTLFYNQTADYRADVHINGLKNSNQSLTVLVNMFTAAKAAKQLGFTKMFYSTYDVILHEKDIPTVEHAFESLESNINAFLGSLKTPFGFGIETNGMAFKIDWFLNTYDDVRSPDAYNNICASIGAQNFLEDYLIKKIGNDESVMIIHNEEQTLLKNSGRGVASNSEYYSILPIYGHEDEYMFYFYSYNLDDRKVNVLIYESEELISDITFTIKKCREYKKAFKYKGKEIRVEIDFWDGDNLYKTEKFIMNDSNIEKYKQTGSFKWLNEKFKIKVVHIQTNLNHQKERKSREQLEQLKNYGFEYVLHQNIPYQSLPPIHNCNRPNCVSLELFDEETVKQKGTALTPAHYGCFEAFKNAILSEFDDCDFLMVCEGDCIIEKPFHEFANAVQSAAALMNQHNIGYMSFGDTKTLEHGWHQSNLVEEIPNQDLMFVTDHIIGIQCIMFPKFAKKWLKEQLMTRAWDAADTYFNIIFQSSPYKMGIVKQRMTTQADGFSLIDRQDKKFQ